MPKCPKECGKCNPFIFRKSVIPAAVADDTVTPPKIGAYCNALVVYEATGNAYLFSSDGIPTLLSATDYELLANLPSINGVTVVGDLTLEDLGIAQLVEAEAETRAGADTYLQEQIDAITLSSDVVDIVGTYQELEDYDTSHLSENDIIKVLADETVGGATTYYRWVNNSWKYIGEEGPYYTKSQTDALLDEKLDTDALDDYYDKDEVDDLLDDKADVSALADKQDKLIAGSNITIDQATNVISATVPSLDNYYTKSETYSQNEVDGLISGVEAQIPTSTSQLVNDSGFLTSVPIASANDLGGIKVGPGLAIDASGVLSATAPSITVDSTLSTTSTNPVQNKVITSALNNKADISDIPVVPSNISAFYNDVGYVTSATVAQNYYNKTETYTQNEVDGLISGVEAQIPTKTSDLSNDGSDGTSTYVEADDLATVATSGSYNDLLNKPTIYDPEDFYWANVKISDTSSLDTSPTFKQATFTGASTSGYPHLIGNGGSLTFAATPGVWSSGTGALVLNTTNFRPSSGETGNIDLGRPDSLWKNLYLDQAIYHGAYKLTLPNQAGTVALLSDLPTVNNATLTVQKNGSTVGTFTANASSNVTANITVPTKTSDLTNDSGFITASNEQQCEDGANISIDNPNNSPVPLSSVELLGNTVQNTLSGKNLLRLPDAGTSSGITYSINNDGTFNLHGTNSTGYEALFIYYIDSTEFQSANYTLSANKALPDGAGVRLEIYSGTTWKRSFVSVNNSRRSQTATPDFTDANRVRVAVTVGSGKTVNINNLGVMLEKSSSASDFEPFCGGMPAPNPTYPIAVQTTTGEQVVKMRGKNLFNYANRIFPFTAQGITASLADDGTVTITGVPTSDYVRISSVDQTDITDLLEDGATYTISASTISTDFYAEVVGTRNTSGYDYYGTRGVASKTFTVDKSTHSTYKINSMTYTMSNWGTTSKTISQRFQLEKSSSASDFEPYQLQSYEVNLGKNLFDKDNAEIVHLYSSSSGTVANASAWSIILPCEPNQAYTYSNTAPTQMKSDSSINFYATKPTEAGIAKTGSQVNLNQNATATFTAPAGAHWMLVYYRWNASDEPSAYAGMQIELGSQATDYAAYFTPIELCKLGDYQDKIYKSGDDWYVHKEVGKIIQDGTVNVVYYDAPNATVASQTLTAYFSVHGYTNYVNGIDYKCNMFGTPYERASTIWGNSESSPSSLNAEGIVKDGNALRVRILKTRLTGWNDSLSATDKANLMKTWLNTNVPIVYGAKSTATDTQITNQALIDQLDALKAASLYAGENNIMLIPAGGAQGTLDLCFYSSTLPVATSGSLGAVAVGDGLSITDAGVLSVDPPVPTKVSELTNDSGFVTGSIVKANGSNLGTTTIDSTTANYMEVTKLTTATDLNTLQTTGIYIVGANDNTNTPTSNWGTIFVDWTGGTKYQMYIPDGDNTTVYKRKYASSTWGSWVPMDKVKYTAYNVSPASDTTAAWKTALGGEGTYFTWYNTSGKFTNQPSQYGFLRTIIGTNDIRQDWWTQAGGSHYYRTGNGTGWYGASGNAGAFRDITVNNGTLTIQKNGTNVQTFTANQSSNATANITVPTKVSDLTSDVGGNSFYGTSTTAAATAAKEVTVSSDQNFVLKTGVMVTFKAPNTNTARNPTINVNGTGAKPIWFNTAVITTGSLNRAGQNGRPATYVYDGTNWVWVSWSTDDNTTYSTMSVAEGKTGTATSARTMRADYLKQIIDYHIRTADNLSPADDTTAEWKTALGSVNGSYYTWYSTAGKFTHQPSAYGFLETFIQGSDIYQRWHTQLSGPILYRSGNNSGWSDPSDGSWNTVATTANIPTNLSDLYNDMGFASYSAGDHIDITNDVISAVDYVHSENPVTVTGSTPTVTSGMIADGAITASKLAAGVNLTLILSTTDIGEGAALAANTLYGVYQ